MLLVACGGGADTTSLPLQDGGLDVGGDLQSQATDVHAASISDEQAEQIGAACDGVSEVADTGGSDPAERCFDIAQLVFDAGAAGCTQPGPCLRVYEVGDLEGFDGSGVVEVVDTRTSGSLCGEDASGVCVRVGLDTPELLVELVDGSAPTTSTPPPPSDSTTTPSTTTDTAETTEPTTPGTTSSG